MKLTSVASFEHVIFFCTSVLRGCGCHSKTYPFRVAADVTRSRTLRGGKVKLTNPPSPLCPRRVRWTVGDYLIFVIANYWKWGSIFSFVFIYCNFEDAGKFIQIHIKTQIFHNAIILVTKANFRHFRHDCKRSISFSSHYYCTTNII
jgi:hypothetical protein